MAEHVENTNEAYNHGFNDGVYGFSYINPYYTPKELEAWARGFKAGQRNVNEERAAQVWTNQFNKHVS
jgi:hypothetical protein